MYEYLKRHVYKAHLIEQTGERDNLLSMTC